MILDLFVAWGFAVTARPARFFVLLQLLDLLLLTKKMQKKCTKILVCQKKAVSLQRQTKRNKKYETNDYQRTDYQEPW